MADRGSVTVRVNEKNEGIHLVVPSYQKFFPSLILKCFFQGKLAHPKELRKEKDKRIVSLETKDVSGSLRIFFRQGITL